MVSNDTPNRATNSLSPPTNSRAPSKPTPPSVDTDRITLRIDTAASQLQELPTLASNTLPDPVSTMDRSDTYQLLTPGSSRTDENRPMATTTHPPQSRHRGSPVPSARFQPYLTSGTTSATTLRSLEQLSPSGRVRIARLMAELSSPPTTTASAPTTQTQPARALSSTAKQSPTTADSASPYLPEFMAATESPTGAGGSDAQAAASDCSAMFPMAGPSPTATTPLHPADSAPMALLPTALTTPTPSARSPCASEPPAHPHAPNPEMAHAPDVDLSCPICLQAITEAFMTRCGHSFCYQCISAHLEHQGNCPSCRSTLTREQIYPNFILNQILEKRSSVFGALTSCHGQGLSQLQTAIASQPHLQLHDIDQLLGVLLKRRQRLESQEKRLELEILLGFLYKAKAFKRAILGQLQRELACVEDDIADTRQELAQLSHGHASPQPEPSATSADGACVPVAASEMDQRSPLAQPCSTSSSMTTSPATAIQPTQPIIAQRIDAHFKDLQQCYFDHRLKAPLGNADLSNFVATLGTCTRYKLFRPVATLRYGDAYNSSSIVASIEFDRDSEYFATAGVTRKIKVFEFGQIQARIDAMEQLESRQLVDDYCESLNASAGTSPREGPSGTVRGPAALPWTHADESASVDTPFQYYPTREMVCRNKISCLSWNPYIKSQIANSDYEGVVTLWDAQIGVQMATFTEHDKRAWSVDFSRADPTRLASGSDDARVKIWSTGRKQSVLTLESKANICCVKFHPHSSHHLAFGSADHHIYYYDLRQPRHPLCLFKGHRKAVSYVKFLNDRELVSASTDSTLKLWDVQQAMTDAPMETATPGGSQFSPPATTRCQRSFSGHTNEKNFVGLSVSQDWISCGSENNCAYTYYKSLSQPMFSVKFGMVNPTTGEAMVEKDPNLFVSSVCWKNDTNVLMAANSQGTVKVLQLV
ncbi:hypothetical protein H4R35_000167 [Dimargaris xerosporica]|nr:hypothetical protein H4R35_000167 [Dimargaris xerosporica]